MATAGAPLRRGWMAHMLGQGRDPSLVEMTIPGTHDTGTWTLGPSVSKCQGWSLEDQLDNGIRFIDIRLVPKSDASHPDDLRVYHGSVPSRSTDCGVWFSDVIATCRDFLATNPGETVIMSIKNEHETVSAIDFSTALDPFLVGSLDGQGQPLFRVATGVPTLSAAKGRIVLFRRYDYPPAGIGGFVPEPSYGGFAPGIDGVTGWPDDDANPYPTSGSPPLMVQDVYGMSCTSKDKKWDDYIEPFLTQAEQGYPQSWFFNFTSASGGLPPTDFARDINSWLQRWLEQKLARGDTNRLGTVVMDFPAQRSIDLLVAINFAIEPGVIQAFRGYTLSNIGGDRGIGQPHIFAGWNFAQATVDAWMPHSLVKIDGNPDMGRIYPGDVVMIHGTGFTNDEYTYLEGLGDKYDGSQLYYCSSEGHKYGAEMVRWQVGTTKGSRGRDQPFSQGEPLLFRNLSSHHFPRENGHLYSQAGEDYVGTAELPGNPSSGPLQRADFIWVLR